MTTEKTTTKTSYVVLQKDDSGFWSVWGDDVQATSATAAIRAAASKPGSFVAVPARSWKPVTVTVEMQTVVKLT